MASRPGGSTRTGSPDRAAPGRAKHSTLGPAFREGQQSSVMVAHDTPDRFGGISRARLTTGFPSPELAHLTAVDSGGGRLWPRPVFATHTPI